MPFYTKQGKKGYMFFMKIVDTFKKIFFPIEEPSHDFSLPANDDSSSSLETNKSSTAQSNSNFSNRNTTNASNIISDEFSDIKEIFPSIDVNIEYIKVKYNLLINSDIVLREFLLTARNKQYRAFLLFIDGMTDMDLVNNYVLKPLMLKNNANSFDGNQNQVVSEAVTNNITVRKVKKFNIKEYILNCLLPQNNIKQQKEFKEIFSSVNSGNCALFIDTLDIAFDIDVKGFKTRAINKPENEVVLRGPQEAFVENLRTNTSLIRRIINNENLIMENIRVGTVSKTVCSVCYMQNIANDDLVAEVKYRLNNIDIDYLVSSGQLEQLLEDNTKYSLPQIISTERPDKTSTYLLEGRVVVLVNGSPYALIVPAVFVDFLESSEDNNIKFQFANLLKVIRIASFLITLLLPGIYIAITSFHLEFIPTELLFAIVASRASVPFSIIFEIIIMELSFELIREAGLRVPSPIGPTIGIIGALIIGQSAVEAGIVSPILIIIVAITGITSFAIPDYYLAFHCRIWRFMYIIFGYLAGLLGIAFATFIHVLIATKVQSFGVSYLEPYIPSKGRLSSGIFNKPIWKREKREDFLDTKKKDKQEHISMKWRF